MDFQDNFKEFLSQDKSENEEMTQEETKELQEAIDKSKATAAEEEKQREYERQAKEIQRRFYRAGTSTSEDTAFEQPPKESPKTPNPGGSKAKNPVTPTEPESQFWFTHEDLIEVSGVALDIVSHEPQFERPCDGTALAELYQNVAKLTSKLARNCLHRVPVPRPILPTDKPVTEKKRDEDKAETPVQDVYVSSKGRHVKKRSYAEGQGDSDSDSDFSKKKTRADDSDAKITLDVPFTLEEGFGEKKTGSKAGKPKRGVSRAQPSYSTKKYSSRSDEMFDRLIGVEEKKRQQEEEMEDFERTLSGCGELEEEMSLVEGSPSKESKEKEESLVRHRVTPPIPTKGKGRGKRTAKEALGKKDTTTAQKPDSGVRATKCFITQSKSLETKSKSAVQAPEKAEKCLLSTESSTEPKPETVPCPLCGRYFPAHQILNHASNCCDEAEAAGSSTSAMEIEKTEKCNLCEQEILVSEFGAHYKQCVGSKVSDL